MRVEHPAFFETLSRRGAAKLVEVSYSGARLVAEDAGLRLGEAVMLYVWAAGQEEPFQLPARVANIRDDGFAVEYQETGQEVCQWVDALQAAAPALDDTGTGT